MTTLMKELVKGLVTDLPSSSGTGKGDEGIPVALGTEVGHGTGTGAEVVPVAPRPSTEVHPDYGTGTGAGEVPVAPRSEGVTVPGVSEAVVKQTTKEIEQTPAFDSDEELRDLDLIPSKSSKGKGKVGGSFQGVPDFADLQRPTFENLPTDLGDALTSMMTFLETLLMRNPDRIG